MAEPQAPTDWRSAKSPLIPLTSTAAVETSTEMNHCQSSQTPIVIQRRLPVPPPGGLRGRRGVASVPWSRAAPTGRRGGGLPSTPAAMYSSATPARGEGEKGPPSHFGLLTSNPYALSDASVCPHGPHRMRCKLREVRRLYPQRSTAEAAACGDSMPRAPTATRDARRRSSAHDQAEACTAVETHLRRSRHRAEHERACAARSPCRYSRARPSASRRQRRPRSAPP